MLLLRMWLCHAPRAGAAAAHRRVRRAPLPLFLSATDTPGATLHEGGSESAAASCCQQRMREAVRRPGCCGTAVSLPRVTLRQHTAGLQLLHCTDPALPAVLV